MKKKSKKDDYWMRPAYKGFKMADVVHRPGALSVLAYPSRMCNTLFYPNGTIIVEQPK